ncbi:MAG: NAD(P)H-binding protein [Proteobacteria bacterium]|nr:NAD(P)H-binding protein [Pseudomonadota bacterium]
MTHKTTKPKYLITGATGKTGTLVTEQLRAKGANVRAMVRKIDARSDRLTKLGAEVVIGDFYDLTSLKAAMTDIEGVYFCYPAAGDRLLEAAANVAIAAKEKGVSRVVDMSQISALETAKSPLSYQHWQAEQVLDWADVGAVHIRPTFFAEDLYLFTGGQVKKTGQVVLPFGQGRHAPIAANDIAAVVVALLKDPKSHIGERLVLTGPESLDMATLTKRMGAHFGLDLAYVDVPVEAWQQALYGLPGFSSALIEHLGAVALDHQVGIFDAETSVVEDLTGRAPEKLEAFIERNRDYF